MFVQLLLLGCKGDEKVNQPPSTPVVQLSPSAPTYENDLTVVIETPSVDPDGDEVSYAYQWFHNEIEVVPEELPFPSVEPTVIPARNLRGGDSWRVVVLAS